MSLHMALIVGLLFVLPLNSAHSAAITDFGIYSQSDVTLEAYSAIGGNVYAGGNLEVGFGYGIQRPSLTSGNMYTLGNYTQRLASDVNGNVYANGNGLLEGSADINGNLTYGGTLSKSSTSGITGSVTKAPNTVGVVNFPIATSFVAGTTNLHATTNTALAPGSYRDFSITQFRTLTLTSGDYYFKSFELGTGTQLNLQVGAGPLRVFVEQDADFGTGLEVAVNGIDIDENTTGLAPDLASRVLFESHSDVLIDGGFLNYFYGTIFAPYGSVTMDIQDMYGSIVASGPITGNVYLHSQPSSLLNVQSVPEPTSVAVLACGAGGWFVSRRRKSKASRSST